MSTQDLINYYANLLILQYVGKPKAYATIQALASPVVMDQLPTQVMNAFNLTGTTALGKQLDVLGKYAGVRRTGYGFTGNPISLNDADFLSLIQMGIVRNNADASLATIQGLLTKFFAAGSILVFDYQNMQMSYMISSAIGSQNLIQLFITQGLLPRPLGVSIPLLIYAPVINRFFGFRTYSLPGANNTPFNSYSSYQTDRPWLTYADAIII